MKNKFFSSIITLLLLFSFCQTSNAGEKAPFGLLWGASTSQIKKLGVKLSPQKSSKYGKTYTASGLQKVLSDAESVILSFGFSDELWRIVVASKTFSNDPYGSDIKSRYEKLVKILSKKYGSPDINHHRSDMYDDSDEFLMGIKTGRGWHYSNFENDSKVWVQIVVRASGMSDGYYLLIYKNKSLEKKVQKGSEKAEEDAL